jgi:hypothetical protein
MTDTAKQSERIKRVGNARSAIRFIPYLNGEELPGEPIATFQDAPRLRGYSKKADAQRAIDATRAALKEAQS